jgi:hypothetical protein
LDGQSSKPGPRHNHQQLLVGIRGRALDGGAAAIGREDHTGQVAGFVRRQEGDGVGDLVDLGAPSEH